MKIFVFYFLWMEICDTLDLMIKYCVAVSKLSLIQENFYEKLSSDFLLFFSLVQCMFELFCTYNYVLVLWFMSNTIHEEASLVEKVYYLNAAGT